MRAERVVETLDLLRAAELAGLAQVRARPREVGALHLVDEALERTEAPLQQERR